MKLFLIDYVKYFLVIPVTTASVERFINVMNRIPSKTRNRILPESLLHYMIISIECSEIPTDEFLDSGLDLYVIKKSRRIKLI